LSDNVSINGVRGLLILIHPINKISDDGCQGQDKFAYGEALTDMRFQVVFPGKYFFKFFIDIYCNYLLFLFLSSGTHYSDETKITVMCNSVPVENHDRC